MKKIFLTLILVLPFIVLHAEKKQKKSDIIASAVATKVLEKKLVMYYTNVITDMGKQVYENGMKVTLIDSLFSCNLPYSGNSKISTYGSQDLSIVAEEVPVVIDSEYVEKRKYYKLKFSFTSKYDNELFDVLLKIYTNGKVVMDISSSKRSTIKYMGGLYVNY